MPPWGQSLSDLFTMVSGVSVVSTEATVRLPQCSVEFGKIRTRINLSLAQTYLPRTKLVLIINTSKILTSDISNIIQIKSNYMYIS